MAGTSRPLDIAVDVLSVMGAVLWSIQLIPQIVVNWRRKTGDGLQPSMMVAWALAGLPLGIHNILSHQPIALQVQAQILTALSLATLLQVMYYDHKWSLCRCALVFPISALFFGAVEAAFVFGFRYGTAEEGVRQRAILSMAILSAIGLCLGVLRQHYDVYRHRTVRGIAWTFVALDAGGDLTSLLSVTVRAPVDRMAAAIYASELALWIIMMALGVIFNLRSYIQRKRERDVSSTVQELQEHQPQPQPQPQSHNDEHIDQEQQRQRRPASLHSVSSSAFNRIVPAPHHGDSVLLRRVHQQHGGG